MINHLMKRELKKGIYVKTNKLLIITFTDDNNPSYCGCLFVQQAARIM